MTAERDTLASYDATLEGQATHNDRLCHVLRLTAKSRTVAYPLQKLWIDTETYIVLKAEYSTATGRLLKTMEVLETADIASRTIAVKTLISDKMKRDSSTLMTIDTLEVNIPLDPKLFSIEELTW
jgi:negative regulator of sigma E activity